MQLADGLHEGGKPYRVVIAVASHESHGIPILIDDDAPAVVLLFVDPAGAVKRLAERRANGLDLRRRLTTGHRIKYRGGLKCAAAEEAA